MSGIETAAVIAVAVWLGVLSFTLVLLVRQISLVTAWVQQQSSNADDGLDVGVDVPGPTLEMLPELREGLAYVLFLGGDCQPCREFALEAGRSEELEELHGDFQVVASVTGDGPQADDLVRMLPDWVRVARHGDASEIQSSFEVRMTPSVFEVERGTVTGQATAGYGVINFLNLIRARATSDAAEFAGPVGERELRSQSI